MALTTLKGFRIGACIAEISMYWKLPFGLKNPVYCIVKLPCTTVPIFFAIVVFIGFFGNLLVVLVVTFNKQMRNTTNLGRRTSHGYMNAVATCRVNSWMTYVNFWL